MMTKDQILALLPHREPFLMVDELVSLAPGQGAVGIKHVRADEDWARGHFPGNPILPGVLITEALAQVAALVYLAGEHATPRSNCYLVGVDKMRYRRIVRPGDTLHLKVTLTGHKRQLWFFDGAVTTNTGDRVANGSLIATIEEA